MPYFHIYAMEWFEPLQKQWMSLLIEEHPICRTERVYPKSGIFKDIWESEPWGEMVWWDWEIHMWYIDDVKSTSHLNYVAKEGSDTPYRQCMSLLILQDPIHCTYWEGTENLSFWMQFETQPQWYMVRWDPYGRWLADAVRRTSHLHYASNKGLGNTS